MPIDLSRRAGHPAVEALREAIEEMPLAVNDRQQPNVDALKHASANAWHLWHNSPTPRSSVGALLPAIIRDARRAARILDVEPRRSAYATLTSAYGLAHQVLAWVSDTPLLWLVADRAMNAAEHAGDPESLALGAWVLGNVWRASEREEDAYQLVTEAGTLLEPYLNNGDDTTRALWGALHLHGAITAARLGREGDALFALDQADKMPRKMPSGYVHSSTVFGAANADTTGVNVYTDLRKSAHTLDADIDALPSVHRRSRLWLDMARSYHQRKDRVATLQILQRATDTCEESMRHHPMARGIAGELVSNGGRNVQRDARVLAKRLGLTA